MFHDTFLALAVMAKAIIMAMTICRNFSKLRNAMKIRSLNCFEPLTVKSSRVPMFQPAQTY